MNGRPATPINMQEFGLTRTDDVMVMRQDRVDVYPLTDVPYYIPYPASVVPVAIAMGPNGALIWTTNHDFVVYDYPTRTFTTHSGILGVAPDQLRYNGTHWLMRAGDTLYTRALDYDPAQRWPHTCVLPAGADNVLLGERVIVMCGTAFYSYGLGPALLRHITLVGVVPHQLNPNQLIVEPSLNLVTVRDELFVFDKPGIAGERHGTGTIWIYGDSVYDGVDELSLAIYEKDGVLAAYRDEDTVLLVDPLVRPKAGWTLVQGVKHHLQRVTPASLDSQDVVSLLPNGKLLIRVVSWRSGTLSIDHWYYLVSSAELSAAPRGTKRPLDTVRAQYDAKRQAHMAKPDAECVLCTLPYSGERPAYGYTVRGQPTCEHIFCRTCAESWMRQGKTTCPMCRATFDEVAPVE